MSATRASLATGIPLIDENNQLIFLFGNPFYNLQELAKSQSENDREEIRFFMGTPKMG